MVGVDGRISRHRLHHYSGLDSPRDWGFRPGSEHRDRSATGVHRTGRVLSGGLFELASGNHCGGSDYPGGFSSSDTRAKDLGALFVKLQSERVHAVALTGGGADRVIKQVAQVSAAGPTHHLGAHHSEAPVFV